MSKQRKNPSPDLAFHSLWQEKYEFPRLSICFEKHLSTQFTEFQPFLIEDVSNLIQITSSSPQSE